MEQQPLEKLATNPCSMAFKKLLLTVVYSVSMSVGCAKPPVNVHQNEASSHWSYPQRAVASLPTRK